MQGRRLSTFCSSRPNRLRIALPAPCLFRRGSKCLLVTCKVQIRNHVLGKPSRHQWPYGFNFEWSWLNNSIGRIRIADPDGTTDNLEPYVVAVAPLSRIDESIRRQRKVIPIRRQSELIIRREIKRIKGSAKRHQSSHGHRRPSCIGSTSG